MTVAQVLETPLWDVADVAKFTGMSITWVKRATAAGRIPSMKLGGARRYDPADIAEWVEKQKRKVR